VSGTAQAPRVILTLHSKYRGFKTATMRLYGLRKSAHFAGRTAQMQRPSGRCVASRVVAAPTAPVEFEAVNHQEKPFEADIEKLQLNEESARDLYQDMKLGRDFEDMCAQMYYRGKMFGFVHLYCGQEAVSSGIIRLLKKNDFVCRCVILYVHSRLQPAVGSTSRRCKVEHCRQLRRFAPTFNSLQRLLD
jgi:hypothetical protein